MRKTPFLLISIDEVVSGNSAIRTIKAVEEGINIFSSEMLKTILSSKDVITPYITSYDKDLLLKFIKSKIKYESICFEHGEYIKHGGKRHSRYEKIVEEGIVIPIEVEYILTMDRPSYCPIKYVPSKKTKWFLPVIENDFHVTAEYINFLADIASIVGTDPSTVHLSNLRRILDHQAFIPEKYKKECNDSCHHTAHVDSH